MTDKWWTDLPCDQRGDEDGYHWCKADPDPYRGEVTLAECEDCLSGDLQDAAPDCFGTATVSVGSECSWRLIKDLRERPA